MAINWEEYIKERIYSKASTDEIISELQKEGLSKQRILEIVEKISQEKEAQKIQKPEKSHALKRFIIGFAVLVVFAIIILALYSIQKKSELESFEEFNDERIYEPVQKIIPVQTFSRDFGGQQFRFTKIASYNVTVMIGSIKEYADEAKYSSFDMVFLWGKLANPNFEKHLKIEQKDRQWFSEFTETGPYACDYIAAHGANTHLISSTNEIAEKLATIKPKNVVSMQGFLVDVETTTNGVIKQWKTSTTRIDAGLESCEIFYVESVEIL